MEFGCVGGDFGVCIGWFVGCFVVVLVDICGVGCNLVGLFYYVC